MRKGLGLCPYVTDGHKPMGSCGNVTKPSAGSRRSSYHPFRVSRASRLWLDLTRLSLRVHCPTSHDWYYFMTMGVGEKDKKIRTLNKDYFFKIKHWLLYRSHWTIEWCAKIIVYLELIWRLFLWKPFLPFSVPSFSLPSPPLPFFPLPSVFSPLCWV